MRFPMDMGGATDDRQFYDEKQESKNLAITCPHCREENEYPVRWLLREKKNQPPPGLDVEGRKRFEKARSYLTRVDDMLACRNIRCRKRFEIPSQQTVILL